MQTIHLRIMAIALAYTLFFTAVAEWRRVHSGPSSWIRRDSIAELGAEYDQIARAIRAGRGFADPFHEPSGPTAWMPPLIPYELAFFYWLTNDARDSVARLFLTQQTLIVWFTAALLLSLSHRLGLEILGHGVVVLGFALNFHELFQKTHDSVLLMFLVNWVWLGGLLRFRDAGASSWPQQLGWGLLGGIAALASPVVAGVWLVVTLAGACRRTAFSRANLVKLIMVFMAAACIALPWTIRNRLTFGKWIPIKSNAPFELWQSQCLDDDGVSDMASVLHHPFVSRGAARQRYLELGEAAFIEKKKAQALAAIAEAPLDYLWRVSNRAVAIAAYYQPRSREEEGQEAVLLWKRSFFPLPFVAFCLIIASWRRATPGARIVALIYFFYLLPYLLLGYNPRYATPIFAMKIVLVLYASWIMYSAIRRPTTDELSDRYELVSETGGFKLFRWKRFAADDALDTR